MIKRPLYVKLASRISGRAACEKDVSRREWFHQHTEEIERLVKTYMPSGSGFNSGTRIDLERSTDRKLVFHTGFHHMDEGGGYSHWTDHDVIVTASLLFGVDIHVTGPNDNDIRDYVSTVFHDALMREIA